MKMATEEHRVITVITAAKQTLFRGRSQTYELSHTVEGGINLTEHDVMTGCMATYPDYPVPERMKGPGEGSGRISEEQLFFPAPSRKAHRHSAPSTLPGVAPRVRLAFTGPIKH